MLKRETYSIDDNIFMEDEIGPQIYYITSGNVILVNKKTFTFIKELGQDDFMGEYAFFSGLPRKATARSKSFTEVLTLYKMDFLAKAEESTGAIDTFTIIQNEIVQNNDLSLLGVVCYVCQKVGHLSVDCSLYFGIKGNLQKLVKDTAK